MSALPGPSIRIVLCRPSHQGNVGAAARAMKVMGLSELVVVAPREPLGEIAESRATNATDVLGAARVVDTLREAVDDCVMVVGLSARARHEGPELVDVREGVQRGLAATVDGPVAFMFGTERTGLSNEELLACHLLASIPTGDALHSLNLGAAVQVVCYELLRERGAVELRDDTAQDPPASRAMTDALVERLWQVSEQTGEIVAHDVRYEKMRDRLVRLLAKAAPTESELRAAHGVITWYARNLPDRRDAPEQD